MQHEADTTRTLARIVGPTLIVGGLFLLTRRNDAEALLDAFTDNDALSAVSGFTAVVAGLVMLTYHHRIYSLPSLTLTLLGALMFVRGVLLLFAPTFVTFSTAWFIQVPFALDAASVLVALFGAWISTVGFSGRRPPIAS